MALEEIVREYGNAFRNDWNGIDGRMVRDDMYKIANWIEATWAYPGDKGARFALGLCPRGLCHWVDWCDNDCKKGNDV